MYVIRDDRRVHPLGREARETGLRVGAVEAHGHLAEIAKRLCLRQSVFTRPRPFADVAKATPRGTNVRYFVPLADDQFMAIGQQCIDSMLGMDSMQGFFCP